MSWPPTDTAPAEGVTMPQTMLMSVVLPAPFGPSSAKISPRRISRSTLSSAWKPDAYLLVSPRMDRMGGAELLLASDEFADDCMAASSLARRSSRLERRL